MLIFIMIKEGERLLSIKTLSRKTSQHLKPLGGVEVEGVTLAFRGVFVEKHCPHAQVVKDQTDV